MTPQPALRDLIERMEAAKEGSRELDALIAVTIGEDLPASMGEAKPHLRACRPNDNCAPGHYWLVQRSGMSLRSAKHYTTSIDAALTLVPEKCYPTMLTWNSMGGEAGFCRMIVRGPFRKDGWHEDRKGEGRSPALAVCIAALKARLTDD